MYSFSNKKETKMRLQNNKLTLSEENRMGIYGFATLNDYDVSFHNGSYCFLLDNCYAPISDEFMVACKVLLVDNKFTEKTFESIEELNNTLQWFDL